MKFVLILLPVAFIVGCSEENKSELDLNVPNELSSEVKSIVEIAWPKVKAACPGLNKYASDLEFQKVDDNFSYASSKDSERVSIVFKVK